MSRMMKSIKWILAIGLLLFIMTGCGGGGGGGNDKPDSPPTSEISLKSTTPDFNTSSQEFTMEIGMSKAPGIEVELSKFKLYIPGCDLAPGSVSFDPQVLTIPAAGTDGTLRVKGEFANQCDNPQSYTLGWHEKQTYHGESKEFDFSAKSTIGFGGEGGDTGAQGTYKISVSPVVIEVHPNEAEKTESFTVQLSQYNEESRLEPVADEEISVEVIDPKYGEITPLNAMTDENGRVTFVYKAPGSAEIYSLVNSEIKLNIYMHNKSSVHTSLPVKFVTGAAATKLYILPNSLTITKAGEEHNITIVTVNNDGIGISTKVNIEQPSIDKDYGSFSPAGTIQTDASGRAVVTYKAPDSISSLEERNITFTAQIDNKTQINKTLNLKFSQGTGPGADYEIELDAPDSLEVNSSNHIAVKIHEVGNPQNIIDDDHVLDVNVTTLFPQMLTLDGQNSYNYQKQGVKSIPVESKTLSGTAVVEVSALINNGDHKVALKKQFPVVIMSGPVVSISIFYRSTSEKPNGIFVNHYTIHAVDKYNNPARPGLAVTPALINGTKVVRSRNSTATGKLIAGDPAEFQDDTAQFGNVEVGDDGDILIVIPNSQNYARYYLGTWSIDQVNGDHSLGLSDAYSRSSVDQLSYIIGGSSRYILDYGIATVHIVSETGKYETDENGNVLFEAEFDPVLAGHTVTIGASTHDRGHRTGVAKIEMLRWGHYTSTSKSVPNDGDTHLVTLSLGIANSSGEELEHLIGVDIPYTGITSSSAQCVVDGTNPNNNMHTDRNGQITVAIDTLASDSKVKECAISWIKSDGGIYLEY